MPRCTVKKVLIKNVFNAQNGQKPVQPSKSLIKLCLLSYGCEQTNNDYYNAHAYSKHVQHIYTISVTQSHVCISPVTTIHLLNGCINLTDP